SPISGGSRRRTGRIRPTPRADAVDAIAKGKDQQPHETAEEPNRRQRFLSLSFAADPDRHAGDLATGASLGAPEPVAMGGEFEMAAGVGAAGPTRPARRRAPRHRPAACRPMSQNRPPLDAAQTGFAPAPPRAPAR